MSLVVKLLAGALSLSVSVIIAMTAAWASESNHRIDVLDQRVALVEQHYVAIQTDLQDLRGHLDDLKELIKAEGKH